ncbi:hypothetical protein AGLY_011621, partial [Aphis glycines]
MTYSRCNLRKSSEEHKCRHFQNPTKHSTFWALTDIYIHNHIRHMFFVLLFVHHMVNNTCIATAKESMYREFLADCKPCPNMVIAQSDEFFTNLDSKIIRRPKNLGDKKSAWKYKFNKTEYLLTIALKCLYKGKFLNMLLEILIHGKERIAITVLASLVEKEENSLILTRLPLVDTSVSI